MGLFFPLILGGIIAAIVSSGDETSQDFLNGSVEVTIKPTEDKDVDDKLLIDFNHPGEYTIEFNVIRMKYLGEATLPQSFSKIVTKTPCRETITAHLLPKYMSVTVKRKRIFWADAIETKSISRPSASDSEED